MKLTDIILKIICFITVHVKRTTEENVLYNMDDYIYDLTSPTIWEMLVAYVYDDPERVGMVPKSTGCILCGNPYLGTTMHLHLSKWNGMPPSELPVETLIANLVVVDISHMTMKNPYLVLVKDMVLHYDVFKNEPDKPTLLIFKFGWKWLTTGTPYHRAFWTNKVSKSCGCALPGLGLELANYILANLTTVVGIGTDLPSLESEETRGGSTTIADFMGANGVYMIQNIDISDIPEVGCTAVALPFKVRLNLNIIPTRLIALCSKNIKQKTSTTEIPWFQDTTNEEEYYY